MNTYQIMTFLRQSNLLQIVKFAFSITILLILSACVTASPIEEISSSEKTAPPEEASSQTIANLYPSWQTEFNLDERVLSDIGESEYFILVPGFQLVLESSNEHLTITVLDETKEINGVTTRVLEEREERNGELYEVSRNFYAIDNATGDAFYFGEDVDYYENGEVVRHSGEWLAYEGANVPGIIVPGAPDIGMRYFQEIAPGVAMDRAEVISLTETFTTPAGVFENSLVTQETSPLEPNVTERKTYASGIGLIQDQRLLLVSYGYISDENP
jgi:hypothetical protein